MRSVLRFIAPSSENIELRRAQVRRLFHAGVYPPARALVCVEVHAHDRWTAEGDRHRTGLAGGMQARVPPLEACRAAHRGLPGPGVTSASPRNNETSASG